MSASGKKHSGHKDLLVQRSQGGKEQVIYVGNQEKATLIRARSEGEGATSEYCHQHHRLALLGRRGREGSRSHPY